MVRGHHHMQNPDFYQSGFFFARSPCNGGVWRIFLLSGPAPKTLFFAPRTPFSATFLSLFSAGLLSVQCIRPRKIKGSHWSGCENKALPVTDLSDEIAAARHRLRTRVLRMAKGIWAPSAVNLTPQALLYTIAVY